MSAAAAAAAPTTHKLGPDEDLKVGQRFYYYERKEIAPGRYGLVKITCFVIGKYVFTNPDDYMTEPGQILYFLHESDPGNKLLCMLSPYRTKDRTKDLAYYRFRAFGNFDVFVDETPFDVKDYINVLLNAFVITEKDKERFEMFSHFPKTADTFNFDVLRYIYVPSMEAEIGELYWLKGLDGNDNHLVKVEGKSRYMLDDSNYLIEYSLPYSDRPDIIHSHAIWNTSHPSIIQYALFKMPSLEDIRSAAWKRRSPALLAWYSRRHPPNKTPKNSASNGNKTRRSRRRRYQK